MPVTDHRLTKSILSELFWTASASATTLSLKAILYDERPAIDLLLIITFNMFPEREGFLKERSSTFLLRNLGLGL